MKPNLRDLAMSPQDLKEIILEVRRYARWYAQNDVKTHVTGGHAAEPLAIAVPAAKLIQDLAHTETISQKTLDGLIQTLEEYETSAPRITITLAALPSVSLKSTLAHWCRDNIDPNILVDFRFNATILGGMVVKYGSHIHDWSFRRQILTNRAKFPEVLRRV